MKAAGSSALALGSLFRLLLKQAEALSVSFGHFILTISTDFIFLIVPVNFDMVLIRLQ